MSHSAFQQMSPLIEYSDKTTHFLICEKYSYRQYQYNRWLLFTSTLQIDNMCVSFVLCIH